MIPGLVLLAFGCAGWLLYAAKSYSGMMELMLFSFPVLCPTALIWLIFGVTARIRSVDPGLRWRVLGLSLLIGLAWITPGAAIYLLGCQRAAMISASI